MSTTLAMEIWAKCKFDYDNDDNVLATVGTTEGNKSWAPDRGSGTAGKITITSGSGDLQMNRFFFDRRELTLSTGTDDLDLAGGLTDVFGQTLTFKELKLLWIHNRGMGTAAGETGTYTPTDGEDLQIGGAAAAALSSLFFGTATSKLLCRSGGMIQLTMPYQGYSVSPGTADVLRIEHKGSAASGGDISYDILIGGVQ